VSGDRYESLSVERDGAVLRVWLDRPERLNVIDNTMLEELATVYDAVATDFAVRVVVLGGRGRTFCAGFDRKVKPSEERREVTSRERRYVTQLGRRACRAIEECEAITVARLHAHVLGGGFCFAQACDFRVASTDVKLRLPEVEIGLPLGWGAVPRLLQEVGASRAREILMLAGEVDAERARQWGLVHRVAEPDALDAELQTLVEQILAKPELPLYQTKTQLRGYAALVRMADASESDGDLIATAGRAPEMLARFAIQKE
jgi:enoyl-CoA hydratase/carnithine racemase